MDSRHYFIQALTHLQNPGKSPVEKRNTCTPYWAWQVVCEQGRPISCCVRHHFASIASDTYECDSLHIYQCLGFTVVDPEPTSTHLPSAKATIAPPVLNTDGDRRRLLRAWVELGAWLQDYRKRFRELLLGLGLTFMSDYSQLQAAS